MIPIQERLMTFQHKRRQKANIWTDARANLILEILGAMRVVKYFSYEIPFLKREHRVAVDVHSDVDFTK